MRIPVRSLLKSALRVTAAVVVVAGVAYAMLLIFSVKDYKRRPTPEVLDRFCEEMIRYCSLSVQTEVRAVLADEDGEPTWSAVVERLSRLDQASELMCPNCEVKYALCPDFSKWVATLESEEATSESECLIVCPCLHQADEAQSAKHVAWLQGGPPSLTLPGGTAIRVLPEEVPEWARSDP